MGAKKASLVLLFLWMIVSACANERAGQPESAAPPKESSAAGAVFQPAPTPEQIDGVTAVNPTTPPSAAAAIIMGLVMADSDAGNVPDSPLDQQLVLILNQETAGRLFGAGANLRFMQRDVPLDDPQILTVTTDADGTFSASVPPGETVLCLADEFSEGSAATRGCGQFTANPGLNTLTISVGFGEILLDTG